MDGGQDLLIFGLMPGLGLRGVGIWFVLGYHRGQRGMLVEGLEDGGIAVRMRMGIRGKMGMG